MFKIGDKVVFVSTQYESKGLLVGDSGVIFSEFGNGMYGVSVEETAYISSLSFGELGWSFRENELALVGEAE